MVGPGSVIHVQSYHSQAWDGMEVIDVHEFDNDMVRVVGVGDRGMRIVLNFDRYNYDNLKDGDRLYAVNSCSDVETYFLYGLFVCYVLLLVVAFIRMYG